MKTVRELESQDIDAIINYWLSAEDEYLEGMGVDLQKMPKEGEWREFLTKLVHTALEERPSYCLIWENDGVPIGHCNVSKIVFGKEAYMHLHIWKKEDRKKRLGVSFLKLSIPISLKHFNLKNCIVSPGLRIPLQIKSFQSSVFV